MTVAERRRQDVESSLGSLSLSSSSHRPIRKVPKPQIVDSWEEEASSDTETEASPHPYASDLPSAPPPTPISPSSSTSRGGAGWGNFENPYSPAVGIDSRVSPMSSDFRPEKQTAVAGRLIAGALGVRAPKKTEEQRQYDNAMKEKELKRRNKERGNHKRETEEAEKAKAAIWDS